MVVAAGRTPSSALFDELAGLDKPVHKIGDVNGIGKVLDAIHQAIDLAAQI